MHQAIRLARPGLAAGAGGPFGCVIVRAGEIIGQGHNRVLVDHDPTAHAEVVAIRAACRRVDHFELRDCDLYTSCEPCPMCLGAANWARVARIIFAATRHDAAAAGFDDEWLYREVAARPEARRIPCLPLLRSEAVGLFDEWQAKPDRVPY
jgi:tRNA(Arg) A34 adenosine deaminase TadA